MLSTRTQELGRYLDRYRRGIGNLSVSFETNIDFYTAVNFALMNWAQPTVAIPHHTALCSMIAALGALLRSSLPRQISHLKLNDKLSRLLKCEPEQ